jgi:peptidoglycan hydrolase-like protein with peptidoglycan-binding domain
LLVAPLSRPPVLMAMSFLAVTGGIAANALFLQPRPHPAPLVATRDADQEAEREAQEPERDELVAAVQSGLQRTGYYSGPVDGMAGPVTEAAILAFEEANGRLRTGEASQELLAALGAAKASDAESLSELVSGGPDASEGQGTPEAIEAPAASEAADASEAMTPEPDDRVAAVQHALAISAYGPLQADGIPGPETREAIVRFQRDHGLPPTGEISDQLIVELRAAGALQDHASQDR